MTTRVILAGVFAALPLGLWAAGSPGLQDRATFRSGTDVVTVDVSIRDGNLPIQGLSAGDFRLTDNGVAQTIEAIGVESMPIDVTLFHDTSPSLAGKVEALKKDIREITAMLRPADRLRLLTFDLQINDVFGWRAADTAAALDSIKVGQISSVYDAIFVALMHRPGLDRRHLIVALTDCVDSGSVIGSATVEAAARRAEGVLHIVKIRSRAGSLTARPAVALTRADARGEQRLESAANRTGGELHAPFLAFTNDAVKTFKKIFDDYRQSYVVRYKPAGVTREGWHEITVEVPTHRRATIRARKGYFGGGKSGND